MKHRFFLSWLILAAGCALAGRAACGQVVEESEAAIVLEIERLTQEDQSLDDAQRREALLANLRKIPPLLAAMDMKFPQGKYRALAHRLALAALTIRKSLGDKEVTGQTITAAAKELLALAKDDDAGAQANFVMLQMALSEIPTTLPATGPGATSSPATAALADLAGKFIRLAGDFPRTQYAAPALFLAGGAYLELNRADEGVAALDRLSRDYPKDPYSLKALLILVQLHTQRGREAAALLVKRRCVENFPDSPATLKYRADIAKAESAGKPFFLRFKSVQGKNVDVCDFRGKPVLVYFFASLADEKLSADVVKTLGELDRLAVQHKCALLAVGADDPGEADKVAKTLSDGRIDTPVLIDGDGKVAQQYGVLLVPSVVLVAPDGTLREIVAAGDIAAEVAKALKSPASAPATGPAPTRPAGR